MAIRSYTNVQFLAQLEGLKFSFFDINTTGAPIRYFLSRTSLEILFNPPTLSKAKTSSCSRHLTICSVLPDAETLFSPVPLLGFSDLGWCLNRTLYLIDSAKSKGTHRRCSDRDSLGWTAPEPQAHPPPSPQVTWCCFKKSGCHEAVSSPQQQSKSSTDFAVYLVVKVTAATADAASRKTWGGVTDRTLGLLQSLTRGSQKGTLCRGQRAICFSHQMGMRYYHRLPARCLHDVRSMTRNKRE